MKDKVCKWHINSATKIFYFGLMVRFQSFILGSKKAKRTELQNVIFRVRIGKKVYNVGYSVVSKRHVEVYVESEDTGAVVKMGTLITDKWWYINIARYPNTDRVIATITDERMVHAYYTATFYHRNPKLPYVTRVCNLPPMNFFAPVKKGMSKPVLVKYK